VIRLRSVHKAFGEKVVLKGFDLDVPRGATVALIGASGAGKSVVLKHIVGLLASDQGSVTVDGREVAELDQEALYALRRRVGYVFQFAALFDSMTLAHNVEMGLRRIPGLSRRDIRRRAAECLELVDLGGLGDRYPAEISGGQRKRAGIARAIATRPRYLLYDEPTTGLDPVTTTVIGRLILRLREEIGATGLVVTHDLGTAYEVADSMAFLHDGRVRAHGAPGEIRISGDPVVRSFIEGAPELMETIV